MTFIKKLIYSPFVPSAGMLCLFLCMFPMKTQHLLDHNSIARIIKIIILLILLFFIIFHAINNGLSFFIDEKLFLLFTVIALCSAIINRSFTLKSIGIPVEFLLVYLGISAFFKITRKNNKEFHLLILLLLLLALLCVHIFFGYMQIPTYRYYIFGLFDHSNNYGFVCMSACMLSLASFIYTIEKQQHKLSLLFILIFSYACAGLFISLARGAILGLFIYILLTTLFFFKLKRNRVINKKIWIIIAIIILAVITLFLKTDISILFLEKFNKGTTYRSEFWLVFIKNQLNSFPSMDFFFGKSFSVLSVNPSPEFGGLHNFILEIWGRYGIINALLTIFIIFFLVYKIIRQKAFWFIAGISIGFIIHNMFDPDTITISNINLHMFFFYWMLLIPLRFDHIPESSQIQWWR